MRCFQLTESLAWRSGCGVVLSLRSDAASKLMLRGNNSTTMTLSLIIAQDHKFIQTCSNSTCKVVIFCPSHGKGAPTVGVVRC